MEGDIGDDSGEYASYDRLYSGDEGSLYGNERFAMERSVDWFLNGCTYVYIPNIHLPKGGIEHEEHDNVSTIGCYCITTSVLEDQINQCVSRSLNVHHHLNIRCNSM